MIHYSCDRCRRMIDPAQEVRYSVKIDIQMVVEAIETEEADDDRDHLAEVHQMLESLDLDDPDFDLEDEQQKLTYDLCPRCYRKYVRDPLGVDSTLHVGFSHN